MPRTAGHFRALSVPSKQYTICNGLNKNLQKQVTNTIDNKWKFWRKCLLIITSAGAVVLRHRACIRSLPRKHTPYKFTDINTKVIITIPTIRIEEEEIRFETRDVKMNRERNLFDWKSFNMKQVPKLPAMTSKSWDLRPNDQIVSSRRHKPATSNFCLKYEPFTSHVLTCHLKPPFSLQCNCQRFRLHEGEAPGPN